MQSLERWNRSRSNSTTETVAVTGEKQVKSPIKIIEKETLAKESALTELMEPKNVIFNLVMYGGGNSDDEADDESDI